MGQSFVSLAIEGRTESHLSRAYRFVNATRGVDLAHQGRVAANVWLRAKGLLGTNSLPEGDGLLIQPCQRIHTFFMAYPIDVVFVDAKSEVVALCESLPPFRVSPRVRRARLVIELPAGTIRRTGTRIGDVLTVESVD